MAEWEVQSAKNLWNKITEFLDNNELADLPFADAYAILQGMAGECGITFKDGNITMPTFVYMESESEITKLITKWI